MGIDDDRCVFLPGLWIRCDGRGIVNWGFDRYSSDLDVGRAATMYELFMMAVMWWFWYSEAAY